MRKAMIWGLVLVAVAVIFTAAQGYTPILLEPPTKTVSEVEVVNFPAVQPVSGTVSVGNLPSVQTVGGSVQVTNLPVDADGNLRVSGGGAAHPPFAFTKIAEGVSIPVGNDFTLGPFPTGGWNNAKIFAKVTVTSGNPGLFQFFMDCGGAGITAFCGFGGSTSWDPANGLTQTFTQAGQVGYGSNLGLGPELNIRFRAQTNDQNGTAVVDELWLYLN